MLRLNQATGAFPAAFGLTSLSMQSPTAMEQYGADEVLQAVRRSQAFDRAGGTITLVRNEDYWVSPRSWTG